MSDVKNENGNEGNPGSPSFPSIAAVLRTLPQLAAIVEILDASALAEIDPDLEWYCVASGTTLFHEGDRPQETFIVVGGRFGVFVDAGKCARLVAQIGPGELVADISLVTGEPCFATTIALRDSEVVRIPRHSAERLMASSPHLMLYIIRLLANRLKGWPGPPLLKATKTIGVVPLDTNVVEDGFRMQLHKAFAALSLRIAVIDSHSSHKSMEEIAQMENQNDLVLCLADRRDSAWSAHCLRQWDRVVFVADAQFEPDPDVDRWISAARGLQRTADLLLLNPSDAIEPDGATRWLGRFSPDQIFHARTGSSNDFARIARLITGRAIGLVLSGGGARGFAHVGAIRAFEEAGIPIDLVGGAGMGALIGYGISTGYDWVEIGRRLRHGFVENNPVNDYTLPLISFTRGRKMARLLREQCGTTTIENLWRGFFCVSSNLSTGKIVVHQQGPLWQALRASASIPGIVPPFIVNNQVLVDGGVLNNFPADVMRSLARGKVIGVEVMAGTPFHAKADTLEDKSLCWRLRNRRDVVPGIVSILMRAATMSSPAQNALSRSAVDMLVQPRLHGIDMLSFSSFDAAVELGYRATMESIERLEKPLI